MLIKSKFEPLSRYNVMKHSFFIILFACLMLYQFQVNAQEVEITYTPATTGNSVQIYQFDQYKLNITNSFVDAQNSQAYFNNYTSIDLNEKGALAALLYHQVEDRIEIYSLNGQKLHDITDVEFGNDDPSLQPYVLPNGEVIVRSNIANFSFYDALGNVSQTISNSTSAQQGEAVSELVKDSQGQTMLVYNPKIFRGENPGSRISKITGNSQKKGLFNSGSRYIKTLELAENGRFFAVVTAREHTADQIVVMDLFGNELARIEAREQIKDVSFSDDFQYLTLMSSGRMSVYKIIQGERVGSSSIRGVPLLFAEFIPEDNLLIGLAGEYNEETDLITNAEIKAVDFTRRKIASGSIADPLSMIPKIALDVKRESNTNYLLDGLNRHLNLKVNF